MQLAHPKVAAGVDEHSDFRTHPVRRLLRIPRSRFPDRLRDFKAYVEDMIDGGPVQVGEQARALGRLVLRPRLRLLPGPAMIPFEIVTAGLLPPALREQYGLPWRAAQQRAFRVAAAAVPKVVRLTP